jgi:disulfide bond formation protein DsbB
MAQVDETKEAPTPQATTEGTVLWAWAVLFFAVLASAGSVYLSVAPQGSEQLRLKACPLCFYQRTLIMGMAGVLLVGLAADRSKAGFLCLLSLPLAFGGFGVAAFHEYLVLTDKLECPNGLLGIGTVPAQSLTMFVLVTVVALIGAWAGRSHVFAVVGASILGLLLAWASIASAPPLPPAPSKPYDPEKQPLDMCRPPYRAPQ